MKWEKNANEIYLQTDEDFKDVFFLVYLQVSFVLNHSINHWK